VRRSLFIASGLATIPVAVRAATPITRVGLLLKADEGATSADLSMLETKLTGALIATNRYSVFTRTQLAALVKEQGFSNSAYADPATAAQLGKLAGVAQMLIGTLRVSVTDEQGHFVLRRNVEADVDYQLVEVSTGRVLKADSLSGSDETTAPAGGSFPRTLSELRRKAIGSVVESVSEALAPS
jgi:hypothetical protein